MTLKTRLSRLQAQAGVTPPVIPAAPVPAESALRKRLRQVRPARVQAPTAICTQRLQPEALARALNGEMLATGLIRIEERIPLTSRLGARSLAGLKHIPPLPGETAPATCLYFDTETTGLAGGSGTLAFLVGVAQVENEAIRLVQFLITSFAAEPALLSAVAAHLPADNKLVSFNGKSYDVPLLVTRFRMQGQCEPLQTMPHLDLLHPTRRLFARRWTDCRLLTLERELLGFTRTDDLPGAEAPQAWFSYMRTGQAGLLIKVVEHNRQDIISLAAAHGAIAEAVRNPLAYEADIHALARWLAEEDETRALTVLENSIDCLCDDGKRFYAQLLRRAARWQEAVSIWERLAGQGCIESLERLAKYHEHIRKDVSTASRYCDLLPGSDPVAQRRKRLDGKLRGRSAIK